jgi:uncharacterized protein YecT (DUF1311 family)
MKKLMLQLLFFALVVFPASSSALGQERKPTAAETKLIRDCAAKHADDGEGERECAFKLVADPCAEQANSNVGNANCYRMEASIWDALLNENYKDLMEAIDDRADQDKLKEVQRAWIKYRETTCDFYWFKIHGTMAVPMTAACQLRENARRALLLKFWQRV